ncbi:hypothetical protein BU24DRAFT_427235 [Aaosphaeria arxii CBS 175.79]|uniref:Uncharacterized protein n=1 Tax=Aaosphaeria arxii CBS 175.79 TaxID=1450172 RepID=A0A6A5XDT5_9PLEO|nr:uncharacterized protein BU24DRAFT_427235 [Aaosphaeria arxii CBS 175.79]KAF2011033.1 hypothetical protein BU24DRAFT_427235 [Aaosphaeria arxii CBS 175.79]
MHNRRGFQTVILLAPAIFLLFPLSLVTIALERTAASLFTFQTSQGYRYYSGYGRHTITVYGPRTATQPEEDWSSIRIVVDVNSTSAYCFIAVSIAACIFSLISACGIWELRTIQGPQRHQRIWSWTNLMTNLVTAVASIAILIYASVVQSTEGWKSYEDVGKEFRFTRETWSCDIKKFYRTEDWAGVACGVAQTSRYILIPLAISALLVMVSTWILVRDRGGMSWLFGGKGRYAGFEDAPSVDNIAMYPPPQVYYQQPNQPGQMYPQQMQAPVQGNPQSPQSPAPAQTQTETKGNMPPQTVWG